MSAEGIADTEVWCRHLLFDWEMAPGGKLHPKFFQNAFKRPSFPADFALGMSGRIHSRTGTDLKRFAEKVVRRKRRANGKFRGEFKGVVAQKVERIRAIDVVYDVSWAERRGREPDPAHANFTRCTNWTGPGGDPSLAELDALQDAFHAMADGTSELERLVRLGQLP